MMIESLSSQDLSRVGPAADPEQQHQSVREHRPYRAEDEQDERLIVGAEDEPGLRMISWTVT
jgi:hypothetical protein